MAFYLTEIRELRKEFIEAYQDGEYKKALLFGKRLLEIYQENEDSDNMEYAIQMSNVGVVLDQMERYERAAEYYKKAAVLKKACGGESLSYADTMNHLAIAYHHLARHEQALSIHQKVLEIRALKQGESHEDYAYALYNLGNGFEVLGQYEEALKTLEAALHHAQGCRQFNLLDLADIHGAMAGCFDEVGNYKKAILYYEMTLDLVEKARGTGNPYYTGHTLSLASACEKAGFMDLAVEYCERAVELRRKMMMGANLDYINGLNHLGVICCKAGQFDKAMEIYEDALVLVEELLGCEHIFYADIQNSMAIASCGKKDFSGATTYGEKALFIKRRSLPENDPQIGAIIMTMGSIADEMGVYSDALKYFRQALEIRKVYFGEDSGVYADTLCAMAGVYEHRGIYEAAAVCLLEGVHIRRHGVVQNRDILIWMLHRLGEIRLLQKETTGAVGIYLEAVALAKEIYGDTHPRYAHGLKKAAFAYQQAGDLERAARLVERAMDIEQVTLDEDNPFYLETLKQMADICYQRGEYRRAIRLYQERNDVNFEETSQERREAASTLMAIAACYVKLGDRKKAEAHFTESEARLRRSFLEASPEYEGYQREYTAFFGGTVKKQKESLALRRRQQEEARLFAEEYLKEKADMQPEEELLYFLAMADLEKAMGQWDEAASWYLAAEKQGQGMHYARACHKLGEYYLRQGQLDKALRKWINAKEYLAEYEGVQREEYCTMLGLLGDCYFQRRETDFAMRMYLAWSKRYKEMDLPFTPEYEGRMERLAKLLAQSGRYGESIEQYSTLALELKSRRGEGAEFIRLLFKTVQLHILMENWQEAETMLDRILVLAHGNGTDAEVLGKICDKAGRLYAMAGVWEKAEDALLKAYEESLKGKKCFTKEGLSQLLTLLRQKGDQNSYFSVKNGREV